MRYSTTLLSALVIGSLAAAPAEARNEWELLGSRRVSLAAETDVIEVGRREGKFDALRIQVDAGTIEMYNVRVIFANGEDFSPDTRLVFGDGGRTRVIDLPGNDRTIQRISFRYKSRAPRGHAVVRVFGREAGSQGGDVRPSPSGWDHLGTASVETRFDHDVIRVNDDGTHRSIMISVEGADIEMYNVRVVFNNGESYSPDTRLRFEENSRTRVIDLPGQLRAIRSIDFSYRTVSRGEGKALVHVYGRK